MAAPRKSENEDNVAKHVLNVLSGTRYACSSLTRLNGGAVNFTFRGMLRTPMNGRVSVIVKHAAAHLARNVDFPLEVERSQFERNALRALADLPSVSGPGITIRTPALYEDPRLHEETTMTILEDLTSAIDLSNWLRRYGASTPGEQLSALGRTIGAWLRRFHEWAMSDEPSADALQRSVAQNMAMKEHKWEVNTGRYNRAPSEFPTLPWEAMPVYDEIERDIRTRVFEEGQTVIHGDFWPGNILIRDQALPGSEPDVLADVLVVDFEFCHIGSRAQDLGQCFAELYMSCEGKEDAAAMRMIGAIIRGYLPQTSPSPQTTTDRHLLLEAAMDMGIHLAVFPWNIGHPRTKKTEETVARGNELLVGAWRGLTTGETVSVDGLMGLFVEQAPA